MKKKKMTYRVAITILRKLNEAAEDDHPDIADIHIKADAVLCELLTTLGYGGVVAEYEKTPKWYS